MRERLSEREYAQRLRAFTADHKTDDKHDNNSTEPDGIASNLAIPSGSAFIAVL
ncbi:MAG TPA: hypothetical protein VE843_18520 [Ktedonobacteraceae bacterium]|nr:hypothetical protein [Ktedonobacteraceae bacterium]